MNQRRSSLSIAARKRSSSVMCLVGVSVVVGMLASDSAAPSQRGLVVLSMPKGVEVLVVSGALPQMGPRTGY